MRAQHDLFLPSQLPPVVVEAAEPLPALAELASKLGPNLRLGTTSWAYPGWKGLVYGDSVAPKLLPQFGLTAYSRHPLLRAVEIDRTHYEPLSVEAFRQFAAQVPDDFRFVAKAHEDCTVSRFPSHARYGKKRGAENARFLDATYAAEAVVAPFVEGLGSRAGVLLFQFPPQDVGHPKAFAERLGAFLGRLPKDATYAVEIRNAELLTRAYADALARTGAIHCHNVWGRMPSLLTQIRQIPPQARRPLLIRWILPEGDTHEDAGARYEPFDRIVDEDVAERAAIANLTARALGHGVPCLVIVDNKAEGCAPQSVARLAAAVAEELEPSREPRRG